MCPELQISPRTFEAREHIKLKRIVQMIHKHIQTDAQLSRTPQIDSKLEAGLMLQTV